MIMTRIAASVECARVPNGGWVALAALRDRNQLAASASQLESTVPTSSPVDANDLLRISYHEPIEATLAEVADYPLPVSRSCHLGNNGTYNWGWLWLSRNTPLVLFDHTTYGADRLCLPWTVLGDYGRVAAFYDIDGHDVDRYRGLHVNAPARGIPSKYRGILNYGVHALHEGRPLTAHHYATNLELARRFNGSIPSYDSREVLDNFDLFCGILAAGYIRRGLHDLFDRWAHTRGSRVVFTKVESFESRRGDLCALGPGRQVLFKGTLNDLLAQVYESLATVRAHVEQAKPLGRVGHPWMSLPFAYLFGAAADYARCPDLRTYMHAGGLTSPYYMSEPKFRARFVLVYDQLLKGGFLPRPFRFVLVPIGCCQLFGTSSTRLLGDIIERWRGAVASLPNRHAVLDLLANRTRPFGAGFRRATEELGDRFLAWLRDAILGVNNADANRLPACYDSAENETFNKYGIGSASLLQLTPTFTPSFSSLTWLEGEWLIHVLAFLLKDHDELRGAGGELGR
jgi:hypothetical protein